MSISKSIFISLVSIILLSLLYIGIDYTFGFMTSHGGIVIEKSYEKRSSNDEEIDNSYKIKIKENCTDSIYKDSITRKTFYAISLGDDVYFNKITGRMTGFTYRVDTRL